jgi:hypothetical protein
MTSSKPPRPELDYTVGMPSPAEDPAQADHDAQAARISRENGGRYSHHPKAGRCNIVRSRSPEPQVEEDEGFRHPPALMARPAAPKEP